MACGVDALSCSCVLTHHLHAGDLVEVSTHGLGDSGREPIGVGCPGDVGEFQHENAFPRFLLTLDRAEADIGRRVRHGADHPALKRACKLPHRAKPIRRIFLERLADSRLH